MSVLASGPARLLLAALLACCGGVASAQDWTRPRAGDAASRSFEQAPDAQAGARARAPMVARQRAWDRKMKAVGRSVCSGC